MDETGDKRGRGGSRAGAGAGAGVGRGRTESAAKPDRAAKAESASAESPRAEAATAGEGDAAKRAGRDTGRAAKAAARRQAILAAALDEFSAQGYAAARLDDVAKRAGVAKGTIYLHFADKEALFQELIRSTLSPIVAALEAAPAADVPLRVAVERVAQVFVHEVLPTRRKDIIRLVLTEGRRFPSLAAFYHREVVARALGAMRALVARAIARGEIHDDALAKFPQLLVAPGLVAVLWQGLFDAFEPLDAEAMMKAHVDLLFRALEAKP